MDQPHKRSCITYRPDFWVMPKEGPSYYVDVKGPFTAVWRLKLKLWRRFNTIDLVVVPAREVT